jgi:polyribonucleotide nucleotidyltransferase
MDSVSSADNNNQTQNSTEDHNNIAMAEPVAPIVASTSDAVVTQEPTAKKTQDYEDLFPKLPGAAPTSISANSAWQKPMKPIMTSSITSVFHIPVEERKDQVASLDFGGGSTEKNHNLIKFVMEKTGAKIEMSSSKDQSLTFLISGKQETVLKARRELLVQFQTQASMSIAIPKEHHRYILGRGGAKLQELEQQTATKITMPKATEQNDKITISGPKEGIDKAIHEIRKISDEQSKQSYENLAIPKIYHPFICGPSNENIEKLKTEHPNCRINIPPLSVMKDELSLAGETEDVLAVKAEIVKLWKDIEKKASTVSVEVKKSQHKYVIGPKGNSINEILAQTGVFVEMPSSDSVSETITLRGPQDKLGLALTKVYEKANSVVSYDVNCPNWLHKYIIGKKGSKLQNLMGDLQKQVHIEFLDQGDVIKIEGPPTDADKSREILEEQAKELMTKMDFTEINVDAKYHKHIIGKGGSTVNKLKQETEVMINIPDSDKAPSNVIRIEGNKDGVKKAKEELEALVAKMQNEREKDLIIEARFHRELIGAKGGNIQKIRDDYAAVQISFPDLGSKSDIVKLRGPKDDVEKCSRTLNKMYKDLLENNYQAKVPIFKQFHKFIIGKGGQTIKGIRQDTSTRIDLPESGNDSDVITITGRKENVEKAKTKIAQIQSEMANVVSVDLIIPSKIHNMMIGAGGKLIQSISDDCGGVAIKFPAADAKSDKVTIRGPKEDVEKAEKMLIELSNERQLNSLSATIRAKPEHHKFLIGRNGVNIQSVRDKTGARIIFPSEKDEDREVITILGTKESVAAAKIELESRIKDLDKVVEEIMTVDPKHHKYFVARRGEVIRRIGDEFGGVVVSFPRQGVATDKVTLKGAKDCVEAARNKILETVEDLESQVMIECHIEQAHHRTIMGQKGSNVQGITSKFSVQIKFPEKNPNPNPPKIIPNGDAVVVNGEAAPPTNGNGNVTPENDIVEISGKKENCDAAANALKALVPINIEVEVPYKFHRFIIGQKGIGVRKLMEENDVNIKVPSEEEKSSTIIVTGAPANVERAKIALNEKVGELEQEEADKALKSFEVKIDVKPEYHPKLIGRGGQVIKQLRSDFDVNIQLPTKGNENDESTIIITGYEKNANEAKDAILKIIGDFESLIKDEVSIDPRVHRMIVGKRGAGIRRIMSDYKVDIKMPREGAPDGDKVIIMGHDQDNVLDCRDHLLNIAEEYEQEVMDKEALDAYLKPASRGNENQEKKGPKGKGFEVTKAPWHGPTDDAFPTLGGGPGGAVAAPVTWGPKR